MTQKFWLMVPKFVEMFAVIVGNQELFELVVGDKLIEN